MKSKYLYRCLYQTVDKFYSNTPREEEKKRYFATYFIGPI